MPLPLTVSCFSKIQIGFAFLVPAHLGSPGKMAVKRVCVCVWCVFQGGGGQLTPFAPMCGRPWIRQYATKTMTVVKQLSWVSWNEEKGEGGEVRGGRLASWVRDLVAPGRTGITQSTEAHLSSSSSSRKGLFKARELKSTPVPSNQSIIYL